MESRTKARFVRISSQKAREVVCLIKGKSLDEALAILEFTPNGASLLLKKLLKSAAANLPQEKGSNIGALRIRSIFVNQGPSLKRSRAASMGRASKIRRPSSHIEVVLGD